MAKRLTEDDVVAMLRREAGTGDRGKLELAERMSVFKSYVYDLLAGRRKPGPKVLAYLGLRKVVTYERES